MNTAERRLNHYRDQARLARLEALLDECGEFLRKFEDTVDRSDGTVGPNEAMSLRARILVELA